MNPRFRVRDPIVLAGCFLISLVTACTRSQGRAGIYMRYSVPFSVFRTSQLASHVRAGSADRFEFPLLEYYNRTGRRVYAGHEARANLLALQYIRKLEDTPPLTASPSLGETMAEVDKAAPGVPFSVPAGEGAILAMDLDRCQACSLQDDYLSSIKAQLLRDGISIVIVDIVRTPDRTAKGK